MCQERVSMHSQFLMGRSNRVITSHYIGAFPLVSACTLAKEKVCPYIHKLLKWNTKIFVTKNIIPTKLFDMKKGQFISK